MKGVREVFKSDSSRSYVIVSAVRFPSYYICTGYVELRLGIEPAKLRITMEPAITEGRGVFRLLTGARIAFTHKGEREEFHKLNGRPFPHESERVYEGLYYDARKVTKLGGLFKITVEDISCSHVD